MTKEKCPKCGSGKIHESRLRWSGTGKGEMFEDVFPPYTYLYHECYECHHKFQIKETKWRL